MAGSFTSPDGDIENIFISDYAQLDRYGGAGSLWTWGRNSSGQLGDNTTTRKSSPVQTVSGGGNWIFTAGSGSNVNNISAVNGGIKSDGTLWMWGANSNGQLGDNTITGKSSPVQTVSSTTKWKIVATDGDSVAAIKTDGTLWTWGKNNYGQLGDNTNTNKSSPVQTVAGGNSWKFVTVNGQSMHAIKIDGTLWAWGFNSYNNLGTSNNTHYSSPTQIGSSSWLTVCTGRTSAGAIRSDGTLWMWGLNNYGHLGDNTTTGKNSPVQTIAGGSNWKQIQTGYKHSGGIKNDGTLWMWGKNGYGALGVGTNELGRSSPVQTIAGGSNWKQLSIKGTSTGAIKTDGTLWTWGHNNNGQLGDNTQVNKSSPVQTVAGGTNWKQVTCGYALSTGIYFFDSIDSYPNA